MIILTRRRLLAAGLAWPAIALAQNCRITPPQSEGPFFKTSSPLRKSLMEGRPATLVVTGRVLGPDCKPLANALLDFWHAGEDGDYDNRGFRYRGHQFADGEGRYRLETILPAEYPGRTPHIHAKVQPPGGRILTTQIYFPNHPRNARDGLYRPELEMQMKQQGQGSFDFIVG